MPALMLKCVNAHDRCEGSQPCPWCEPVMPLRDEDGKFASLRPDRFSSEPRIGTREAVLTVHGDESLDRIDVVKVNGRRFVPEVDDG